MDRPYLRPVRIRAQADSVRNDLALRLSASQFLDLLLVGPAGGRTLGLGCGFFAGGALHLLALQLIFNLLGICQCNPLSLQWFIGGSWVPDDGAMRGLW